MSEPVAPTPETAKLVRKRVWNVADFATYAKMSHRRARRLLKRLDAKHGGQLLMPSEGTNREFTFYPAVLAKLERELFEPVDSIEFRLDALEEDVAEARRVQKIVAAQTGQNTRDIARLRSRS